MTGAVLAAYGLEVVIPRQWDVRIRRRPTRAPETTLPIVHLATFSLPEQRDDFGGNVIATMRPTDMFVSVVEYGPDSVGQPLFRARGVPLLEARQFSPHRLQRWRPGHLGCQRFFTANDRAFCVYAVVASRDALNTRLDQANLALGHLRISELR